MNGLALKLFPILLNSSKAKRLHCDRLIPSFVKSSENHYLTKYLPTFCTVSFKVLLVASLQYVDVPFTVEHLRWKIIRICWQLPTYSHMYLRNRLVLLRQFLLINSNDLTDNWIIAVLNFAVLKSFSITLVSRHQKLSFLNSFANLNL